MLIFDTSVILNFLGTGRSQFLLSNLPDEVFAPKVVIEEITHEAELPTEKDADLKSLIESNLIGSIKENDEAETLALSLAGAPSPDDLDDGEAHAIAYSVVLGANIAIDERKGRRIIRERWPSLSCRFTLDLFEIAAKQARLPTEEYAEIVFCALQHARMPVPKPKRAEIVALIGRSRARLCPSLGFFY
jgi:predicted nucleic acid-binding protein